MPIARNLKERACIIDVPLLNFYIYNGLVLHLQLVNTASIEFVRHPLLLILGLRFKGK